MNFKECMQKQHAKQTCKNNNSNNNNDKKMQERQKKDKNETKQREV